MLGIWERNRCLESFQSTFLSEMSFVTLKSISYAFTNCSTKRKKGEGGGGKKTLLIKCLPTEAKLNPNLLNSTNLRSIFIISVAVTDRTTIGLNRTQCTYVVENYQKSLICSEEIREARQVWFWVEATVHSGTEDGESRFGFTWESQPPASSLRAFTQVCCVEDACIAAVEIQPNTNLTCWLNK